MKNLNFILILFLLFNVSTSLAETKTYLRTDYGLGKFSSPKLDSLNTEHEGKTFGVGFGSKMDHVELGVFYRNFSLETPINHDGLANRITHLGSSIGLEMNVFLNKHLGLKLGYAISNYKEQLATSVSASTFDGIKTIYGLEEDHHTSSFFYGVNLDIFGGKNFDVYTSVLNFPMEDGKKTLSGQVGIKIYMNASLGDFFGNR